ncbi:protein of unknown function (plasmid) [Pararobbsia alpina]|uniref:hypothetical protein n=1 Tax=Pararobbsia alpina TaxID=621374 RepID=UPI0039A469A4
MKDQTEWDSCLKGLQELVRLNELAMAAFGGQCCALKGMMDAVLMFLSPAQREELRNVLRKRQLDSEPICGHTENRAFLTAYHGELASLLNKIDRQPATI